MGIRSQAQLNSTDLLYSTYQNKNTDSLLTMCISHAFGNVPLPTKLFIVHLSPALCPRCEGLINETIRKLKNVDTSFKTLMIVDFPRTKPAVNYILENSFLVDRFYIDTAKLFLQVFNHDENNGSLNVPFVYNVNVQKGLMNSYLPMLGINVNQETMTAFYNDTFLLAQKPDLLSKKENIPIVPSQIIAGRKLDVGNALHVIKEDSTYFSDPLYTYINSKDRIYTFIDRLTKTVSMYYWDKDSCVTKVKPKLVEYTILTDSFKVSTAEQINMINNNILKVIYLGILEQMDSNITITASLPKLNMYIVKNDTIINYTNIVSFIHKTSKNRIFQIDTLKYYAQNCGYNLNHPGAKILGDKVFIPLKKGWPVTGTDYSVLTPSNDRENPFLDEFYNHRDIFAIYDINKRKFAPNVGCLDSIFIKYKCGYSQVYPLIAFKDSCYFISDGKSGQINMYDVKSNVIGTIRLFNVDQVSNENKKKLDKLLKSNKNKNKLKYISSLNTLFNKRIVSMCIGDNFMHCLVKDDFFKKYYYFKYNLDTGEKNIDELQFKDIPFGSVLSIDISNVGDSVRIFTLFRNQHFTLSIDKI